MILSVSKHSYITVARANGCVHQIPIAEAQGVERVYDWFGKAHPITVSRSPNEERLYVVRASSGENAVFGENHSILCRADDSARWKRVPISEVGANKLVQLPQRKILGDSRLLETFDLDERGIYLEPAVATDMEGLMRRAAWAGATVARRKETLRIDLERGRPSCFITKYIAGSFQRDLEKTLDGLCRGGVVKPFCLFDDDFLQWVRISGVIHEAGAVVNAVPLLEPRPLEKTGEVYHIRLDNPMTPVELTWFHS